MKKQLIIGIIVITFTSIILVIGSPFQITSNNLIQNNGHQQKVYATSEDDDSGGGDDVEENDGIDDDSSNNDGSGGADNDNEGREDGKISDGESDKSDDDLSSQDPLEELTAENPPEITGEVVTGKLTPNFGITDNLQIAPPLSIDDQTIKVPQAAEEFNPNVKLGDLLKEQSQTDIIQEIPFQTTEPPISKPSDP
ncbi:MAG TPA: hypothetical protein VLA74_05335, partial [Nitrososphaeraceae archaeon]|nr:hypothetical protein [Nitrososphaeraceae archaeon]